MDAKLLDVKIVKAHKTADGKLFEDQQQAIDHARELKMRAMIRKEVEQDLWNGMDKDDVVEFIFAHLQQLMIVANAGVFVQTGGDADGGTDTQPVNA